MKRPTGQRYNIDSADHRQFGRRPQFGRPVVRIAVESTADNPLSAPVGNPVPMYKAQLSDGEQIECEDYEVGDHGVELFDGDDDFIAFVPFAHLLYVGSITDDGKMAW
jgi:hypothetical protein